MEERQRRIEQQQSDEAVERTARAEQAWELLSPRERTSAKNVLEFRRNERPTPEQQQRLDAFHNALAASGFKDRVIFADAEVPTTRAGLGAANFIRWFEGTFGKRVQFVASESGQPLSFVGMATKTDPNTIFLDVAGNRNVLALLGHEWSHTLETTNPGLWKEIVTKMSPLVVDWAKQQGKIVAQGYKPGEAASEFVANVIGDAFADPEFWAQVRAKDANLFQRMVDAFMEWFDTIMDHVSEYGTDAPDVIKDLKAMRAVIIEAMEEAKRGPENLAGAAGYPTTITPEMEDSLKAHGFTDEMIKGLSPLQAWYYLQPPKAQASIRMHHGSGVKGITQWLLDFLGTGEGNAAYGWGLYMAENPAVARRYYNLLSKTAEVRTVGDEFYDPENPAHIAAEWMVIAVPPKIRGGRQNFAQRREAVIAILQHKAAVNYINTANLDRVAANSIEQQKAAYQIIKQAYDAGKVDELPVYTRTEEKTGELYTLDLDVVRGQALDLDRLMWDQSPFVKEAITKSGIDYDQIWTGDRFQHELGARYQKEMRDEGWKHDPTKKQSAGKQWEFEYKRRVSMFLKGIGIPTNTFADGFSRDEWQEYLEEYYAAVEILLEADEIESARAQIQLLTEDLIAAEEEIQVTRNWVVWQPELLKAAPEGERAQPSKPRAEGAAKYLSAIANAPVNEGIEAAEENWRGGIANFGDPQAAIDVQSMRGYFDYRSHLEEAARANLGEEFPVYRLMHEDELEEWKGGSDINPIGVTFNPAFAENFQKFAGHRPGASRVVARIMATPASIVMRGAREEEEIVINPNEISGQSVERVQASKPRAESHKFGGRGEREVDGNGGYVAKGELAKMKEDIGKILDKRKLPVGKERNRLAKQIEKEVRADILKTRAANPDEPSESVTDPWSHLVFTGVAAEFKDAKEGEKETVKTTAKWQKQNYRFDEIPEGMTRAEWSKVLAERVMEGWLEAVKEGGPDADLILREIEWYRAFTHRLRAEFGGAADFMADLLGAFSPRQNVRQNWRNAVDAIWAISSGKYDTLFKELDAYLKADPANTIGTWRDLGKPTLTARSGALFGTNTERGMSAALGLWREIRLGDKPKAKNFTRNLIALSIKATIDVWAARLLDRVAHKPRIPVDAEGAVSGEHVSAFVQDKLSKKRGDVVVTVDIAKLDAAWERDSRVGEGGTGQIGTRYQDFGTWLTRGEIIEMPQLATGRYPGQVAFVNGRHRFAWLRDQGRKTIDVSVPADQEADFRDRFAADPKDVSAELPVKGQFAFGQEVFAQVAAMMRDPATWVGSGISQDVIDKFKDVTPADVQATNWFLEKNLWTKRNWTNEEGSGGSFMHEIEQMIGTRFQVGMAQAISDRPGVVDFKPQDADQARFAADVHADLARVMPEVISLRSLDSLGMFMNKGERSLDTEFTHGPSLEPNELMRVVLYHAWAKDQEFAHISRVIDNPEEDVSENARPGIEVYFKVPVGLEGLQPVMDLLQAREMSGFTMVVDPRNKTPDGKFLGIRLQYVPEYSGDGPKWVRIAKSVDKKLQQAIPEIERIADVATVRRELYDTIVFKNGIDYDETGITPNTLGTVQARAWRRRYFEAVAAKAVRINDQFEEDVESEQPVSDRESVAPAPAGGAVEITAFDPDLMAFVSTEVTPSAGMLRQLKAEARLYEGVLKCLSS